MSKENKLPPLDKRDIWLARGAVGAAAVGLAIKVGVIGKVESAVDSVDAAARALMSRGNTPALIQDEPGIPEATLKYLKTLPTQETEIPEGGGIDDAAYAVDPETFDGSADIREGVEEIITEQLRPEGVDPQANFVVPAHAHVDVPVVPPIDQVPPDAR
jgi:hypothetical protein